MSAMSQIREIQERNERELARGMTLEQSWHVQFRSSAWVFVGNLPYRLTEGDVICVFSQYGEIEDIHLVKDEDTGKSRGFAFIKYEDWRSTVLAVDNMNGALVLGRPLLVDHKDSYDPPKKKKQRDERGNVIEDPEELQPKEFRPGHAYEGKELANEYTVERGVDLFGSGAGGVTAAQRRKGPLFTTVSAAKPDWRAEAESEAAGRGEGTTERRSRSGSRSRNHKRKSHKREKRRRSRSRERSSRDDEDDERRRRKRHRSSKESKRRDGTKDRRRRRSSRE